MLCAIISNPTHISAGGTGPTLRPGIIVGLDNLASRRGVTCAARSKPAALAYASSPFFADRYPIEQVSAKLKVLLRRKSRALAERFWRRIGRFLDALPAHRMHKTSLRRQQHGNSN